MNSPSRGGGRRRVSRQRTRPAARRARRSRTASPPASCSSPRGARKKDEPLDRATQLVGRIVDGGDGDWERATRDCGGGGAKMYIYRVQRRRAAKYLPGVDVRECRESRDTREPSTKEKNIWRREHSRTGWMRALSRGRADILRAAGPVLWLWLGLLLARTRTRIPRTERE
jgi:hypothetical protein